MLRVRVLGIVLFLLGLWIFLAPFTGPAIHLYLTPPVTTGMSMMHMGTSMTTNTVVVNRAMVFFNFLPGLALVLIGVYNIFRGQINVTR